MIKCEADGRLKTSIFAEHFRVSSAHKNFLHFDKILHKINNAMITKRPLNHSGLLNELKQLCDEETLLTTICIRSWTWVPWNLSMSWVGLSWVELSCLD